MKTIFSWRNEFEPDQLLSEINKHRGEMNGAVSLKSIIPSEFTTILASAVQPPPGVSQSVLELIIRKAFFSPAPNGSLDKKNFLIACQQQLQTYKQRELKDYLLLTSLSYAGHFPFRTVNHKGCEILFDHNMNRFSHVDDLKKKEIERLMLELLPRKQRHGYQWCVVKVRARSVDEAYQVSSDVLDDIRGLVNLYLNSRKHWRISSSNSRQPMNDLRLGKFQTLHDKSGKMIEDKFWYEANFVEPRQLINLSKSAEGIRKFITKARQKSTKSKLGDVFWEALRRYNRALDNGDWPTSFRDLWSVLEFITDTGRAAYEVTIRRSVNFYNERHYMLEVAKHLRFRRNRIVHSLHTETEGEALLFQLGRLVHPAMFALLWNRYDLQNHQEFGQFLELPNDTAFLKRRVHLAKAALKRYAN
jgi:hypothetical protein